MKLLKTVFSTASLAIVGLSTLITIGFTAATYAEPVHPADLHAETTAH